MTLDELLDSFVGDKIPFNVRGDELREQSLSIREEALDLREKKLESKEFELEKREEHLRELDRHLSVKQQKMDMLIKRNVTNVEQITKKIEELRIWEENIRQREQSVEHQQKLLTSYCEDIEAEVIHRINDRMRHNASKPSTFPPNHAPLTSPSYPSTHEPLTPPPSHPTSYSTSKYHRSPSDFSEVLEVPLHLHQSCHNQSCTDR